MAKFSGLGGRLYRGETSVDFIGKRKIWYSVSGLLILASALTLFTQGLHLGIEFKGGSSFTVTSANASVQTAETALREAGITSQTIIQKVGNDKIRIQTDALSSAEQNAVESSLSSKFNVTVDSIDSQIIGPSWGEEITRKALYGLFGFLIVVMLYLAMAFESKMAIAAIISVVHDVFITVGIYALVGFEVTPATVIGFLTILGYSLYDTVVVFDKVRENTKGIAASGKSTYSQAANLAVNQTLVRSFNTSLIALLPVGSILFVGAGLLGAGTLKDLSLALFIGLATGTYSSIFIATPILAVLREREPAMQALAKRVGSRGEKGSVTPSVPAQSGRGPRNQPKRNRRR
ncbi:MAG: protein translocase subunit SecF [Actinobacteria bacterium]|nr:protein translocase subunit SecF [Actinomycetota bacterium]